MKKVFILFVLLSQTVYLSAQRPENITFEDAGNYKAAQPMGSGEAHFIENSTDITYTIFFQNTGQDTVYNMRIIDTLSEHLDISSLREEATSHPYNLTLLEDNTIRFSFPNIKLPQLSVNENKSKGFVAFSISPKTDLPLNTFIPNTANIFFDFLPPILTNEVYHTIGEGFTPSDQVFLPNISVHCYPNPMSDSGTFSIAGTDFQQGQFQLLDLLGQLHVNQSFSTDVFSVATAAYPPGTYLYKILLDNELASTGRIVIQ